VLNGIACHGHDNCVAVGSDSSGEGVVVPITDGIPGTAELVPGTNTLSAVSCPTTTFCIAVGEGPFQPGVGPAQAGGAIVPIKDGQEGGALIVQGEGAPNTTAGLTLYGVGCSTANNCWAGGADNLYGGVIMPIKNGYPGSEQTVAPEGPILSVACRLVNCIAVGQASGLTSSYGIVVFDLGSTPLNEGDPAGVSDLYGVACRSTTNCDVVGTNTGGTEGVVVLDISQYLHNAEMVAGSSRLNGVSCRATTVDCLAVGDNGSNEGVVAGIYNGTPGAAQAVAGTQGLNGVACPSNTSCLVVGANSSDEGVLAMIRLPPR
jgi:hypothetical protein